MLDRVPGMVTPTEPTQNTRPAEKRLIQSVEGDGQAAGLEGIFRNPSLPRGPSEQALPSVERRQAKRRTMSRNLLMLSYLGLILSVLAYSSNTLELFNAWPTLREGLYGLILAFGVFGFVVVIYFLRRWEEFSQGVDGRARAEEALSKSEARFVQIEQRIRDVTLLSEMTELLQAASTREEAYAVVVQSMQHLFPHEPGALCLLSASRNVVEAVGVWGDPTRSEQVFGPEDCWALRRGQMHFVPKAQSGAICRHVHPHPQASGYLCMPMLMQTEILGILHLQMASREPGQAEDIREREMQFKQRLVVTVAGKIGMALGNLNLREALHSQSIRDPLTGLFNRRYMEESLERELRRSTRNQRPLGVIMLDLDHFKQINDRSGHVVGDTILRELSNCIQTLTRDYDIPCRYGGEEFTIILPEAPLKTTVKRAEKLRDAFKQMKMQLHHRPLAACTLSLGVAGFPEHGSTAEAVLRAADTALYRAKHEGRDRVMVADITGSAST